MPRGRVWLITNPISIPTLTLGVGQGQLHTRGGPPQYPRGEPNAAVVRVALECGVWG